MIDGSGGNSHFRFQIGLIGRWGSESLSLAKVFSPEEAAPNPSQIVTLRGLVHRE
jgi:hypothetical protein